MSFKLFQDPQKYPGDIFIRVEQYNWSEQRETCVALTQKVPKNWQELKEMLMQKPSSLLLMTKEDWGWGQGCWKYNKENDCFDFVGANWDSSG